MVYTINQNLVDLALKLGRDMVCLEDFENTAITFPDLLDWIVKLIIYF